MENPFEIILERLDRIERAIEKINSLPNPNNEDELMNIEEVSSFLGLTKPTVYGLTHSRKIPHYKNGRRIQFKKHEIIAWIDSKKVKTREEINQMADEYLSRNPLFK